MPIVKIKFFSLYSDVAGPETTLELPSKTSLSDLINRVVEKYPGLHRLFETVKPLVLVNGEKVNSNYMLKDGDEVAFIPPASGG